MPLSRRSVLVVAADDEQRELYVRAFAAASWDVTPAETGAIALARAIDVRPSVVVTELRLSGIDGYDLIRILRRDPDTRSAPIVAISTDALAATAARAQAAGATLVLPGPCPPDVLVARTTEVAGEPASAAVPISLDDLRATDAPARKLPAPHCPVCGSSLTYSNVHATRVGQRSESWVSYRCRRGCGEFEYRQRTRKLRRIS